MVIGKEKKRKERIVKKTFHLYLRYLNETFTFEEIPFEGCSHEVRTNFWYTFKVGRCLYKSLLQFIFLRIDLFVGYNPTSKKRCTLYTQWKFYPLSLLKISMKFSNVENIIDQNYEKRSDSDKLKSYRIICLYRIRLSEEKEKWKWS